VPALSISSISNKLATADPFPVSVTGPSNGIKTYSSSHPEFATIDSSSGLVTLVSGGTTTITVSQAASDDGVYAAAGPVSTQLIVDKAVPVLSIESIDDKFTTDDPFYVSVTSPSDGLKIYSSSDPDVAYVDPLSGQVTSIGGGTTTIFIFQASSLDGVYTTSELVLTQLVVNKPVPTISNFTVPAKNFSDAQFTITQPTSNSSGSFSYSSSNVSVATIYGNMVTIVGGGSSTITATQAATNIYTSATITTSLVVRSAPTISNFTVPAKNFGDVPFTLPVPNSDSDGAFSYTSSNESVATISGSTVTIVGVGSSTITATQALTNNYTSASITTSLVINKGVPTINNFTVPAKNFGDALFTLSVPNSDSGGAFSYTSSNESVATISGNMVTIVAIGSSTITATQAATNNYTSATITTSLVINKGPPTFGNFTLPAKNFGDAPFRIGRSGQQSGHTNFYIRTGGSDWQTRIINNDTSNTNIQYWGYDNQWWYDYGPPNYNYIAQQFRFFAAYVCAYYNITSGSASVYHGSGYLGTYSFTYNGGTSYTGTYTSPSYNDGSRSWDYSLPSNVIITYPTSNSSGSFSYTSSNPSVATISENTITIVGSGSSTITATQSATNNYTSATISTSLVVSPIAPTFGNFTLPVKNFGDAPFLIRASGQAGHTNFYIRTGSSDWQTRIINDDTSNTNMQDWGYDGQWHDTNIGPANEIALQFRFFAAYVCASYNITSGSANVYDKFALLGTYTFTYNGGTSYTGNFVGTTGYNIGAKSWNYSLPSNVIITYPTSNSSGAFTYTSSNPSVATISGSTVTIVGGGSSTITATQAATNNYTSATISTSLFVRSALTISNFTVPAKIFGDVPFTLPLPNSDSDGAFSYTSSNPSVATISGSTVTIVGAGSSTITATQAATNNYTSATITTSLVVSPIAPTFGNFTLPAKNFGDAPFRIRGSGQQSGHTNFYIRTGGSDWQTRIINNDTSNTNMQDWGYDGQWYDTYVAPANEITQQFRFFAAYVCAHYEITSGSANVYDKFALLGTYTFTYNGGESYTGNFVGTGYDIGAKSWYYPLLSNVIIVTYPTSNSSGAFSYTSSNESVATISGSTVTIVGVGSSTITATQAATNNYRSATITASLVVGAV
jgi:uncharacterized protein YjdB